LCCFCCKDGSMERKVTWRTKGFKQYKNGSKGKNTGEAKKKNPTGGMDVCVVFVVRTVACNVKWNEGLKFLNITKMYKREKTPDRQKKKKIHWGHGCLSLISVVCCQVEVSATSWSLVQRSPTDCGVSKMCVITKPRRNEEAQAHVGLSSHRKKNTYHLFTYHRSYRTAVIYNVVN
jgi:hypothetical protein